MVKDINYGQFCFLQATGSLGWMPPIGEYYLFIEQIITKRGNLRINFSKALKRCIGSFEYC
jgi:hypothetical protein